MRITRKLQKLLRAGGMSVMKRGAWVAVGTAIAACMAFAPGAATSAAATATSMDRTAEQKFRGQIMTNYTVSVTDSAGQLNARSTTRIEYTTPLSFSFQPDHSYLRLQSSGAAKPGLYAVDIAGTDSEGCEFEYRKQVRTPMNFELVAEARQTVRRMVTKTVTSNYFLDVWAYPRGKLPALPSTCNRLRTPIAPGVDLGGLLGAAIWFNSAETTLVGTWPPTWTYTSWPFGAVGFMQLWASRPPLKGGVYRLPAPANALAAGKAFTLRRDRASSRKLPGAPSVTIAISGTITFSFKKAR
jgi:hypothetical protein